MLSLLRNVFSYFVHKKEEEIDIDEEFLAQELLNLEIENAENVTFEEENHEKTTYSNVVERTGAVTYLSDGHGLIDGMIYFEKDCTSLPIGVNEKVRYLAQKNADESVKVIKILQTLGHLWDEEEIHHDEKEFKTREHVIIGKVDYRQERIVVLQENEFKFNLDDVTSTIVPMKGDWLELECKVQWDDESPLDIQEKQIIEVISVKPLRSKITSCKITQWNGTDGICSGQIYFNKHSCQSGFMPSVGAKVLIQAIESEQGSCAWRALTVVLEDVMSNNNMDIVQQQDEEEHSYEIEKEKDIVVTKNITFDNVDFNDSTISNTLEIYNNSSNVYILSKWKLLSSRSSSQLKVVPFINRKVFIHPGKSLEFTITCNPKVLGNSRELFVMVFNSFQVKRYVNINIVNNNINYNTLKSGKETSEPFKISKDNIKSLQQRRQKQSYVMGVRPVKPPSFVPVKLGGFPIPDKLWDAVLIDSDEIIYSNTFQNILQRIEETVPSLSAQFNITNYTDRWHALLYIEEIQQNLQMKKYDMPKAFLTPSDGFLKIEIEGLSEKRPSLMCGDRVYVKDIWNPNIPEYEGYIHNVKGNNIYVKFNSEFHEMYNGYDVKIEFHFSRSGYRKRHQAINLAISHLGPNILFPSQILKNKPQLDEKTLSNLKWYNKKLNPGQKEAITNVLKGVSRPVPYCIFGPPGTGKTITVVETIIQILNNIPDSRILVATPSNSSANLLTERLLEYKHEISGSLIRLIANHLVDSETLPDSIKPYCATLDIAREYTAKSKYCKNDNGINLSCRANFVGRHRVTIGTCGCLSTLSLMELPRGHFTHVLVDEAGQATEPEIMIPLTFIDKELGQIILAGDPMQLGPVVLSRYALEFGFGESYLERVLDRVPYQKDFDAFGDSGYDKRLITRLTYNYRSVPEVIQFSSDTFYDSSLVPQVQNEDEWVAKVLKDINDILPRSDETLLNGGIFMYGIKGVNMRAVDSPSWYNPQEATMLLLHACKLFKRNVIPDDVGIITPYLAQIKHLRNLFDSTGTPTPKIGSVEEFQGQERKIILLSTVRSSENFLETDYKFSLGFVKSPKRLNVALTRAQIAVILFGDPYLLSRDPLWRRVIQNVVNHGKYIGCNLPSDLEIDDS